MFTYQGSTTIINEWTTFTLTITMSVTDKRTYQLQKTPLRACEDRIWCYTAAERQQKIKIKKKKPNKVHKNNDQMLPNLE